MPLGNAPFLGTARFRRSDFQGASQLQAIARSAWFTSGTIYTKAIAGSITMSSILGRKIVFTKKIIGSLTMTGSIVKRTSRKLLGTVTASGLVKKLITKKFTGTLTLTGIVRKRLARKLTGSITISATLAKAVVFKKAISGSITMVGTLFRQYNPFSSGPVLLHNTLTGLRRFLGKR